MSKFKLVSTMSDMFHKTKFQTMKHSPEILMVTGIVGIVTSTVLACKATTKASYVLQEHNNNVEAIKKCSENEVLAEKYTEVDKKKDLTIVYAKTSVDFIKLYGPSLILGTLSIACVLSSHNILTKRNAALAAAYETIYTGYKKYRSRVVEKYGDKIDKELRLGIKEKEIEEVIVDEKGKEKVVKKKAKVIDPNSYSEYARFFDDGCTGWSKSSEHNLMFLKVQQAYANDKLKIDKYLFLNDVYAMLGIPKTKAGCVVGWVYDENDPTKDNFVDFGMYDLRDEQKRRFVNGDERVILLDFNVDGNIWNDMDN